MKKIKKIDQSLLKSHEKISDKKLSIVTNSLIKTGYIFENASRGVFQSLDSRIKILFLIFPVREFHLHRNGEPVLCGHFISLVYRCRLLGPPDPGLRYVQGEPQRDQWAWHAGCPPDLIAWQANYRRFF